MRDQGKELAKGAGDQGAVAGALVLFALALLYDVMPVDLIPDIPMVGWVDDFFITVTAGLNLLEKGVAGMSGSLAGIVKLVKWGVVLLGIIAVALVGFGVFGVVKMMGI